MATKLEPIVAYVTTEEKRAIERKAGSDTLSNYLRSKLGLKALGRGRPATKGQERKVHDLTYTRED